MSVLVEACVDSVASALAAERGGAGRLELCDNLSDGGTTPSAGMLEAVKARVSVPVFVIVRPRGGGFVYSNDELDVMRRDVALARRFGADGIVAGVLTPDAAVDVERMREIVMLAGTLPVTFHRAFDLTRDLETALEALVTAGVARVLTSGGAPTALEGAETIARLVTRAAGRIAIMAGGGVREENVASVVGGSGVREVHMRGTRLERTSLGARSIPLRKSLPDDEALVEVTDEARVAAVVREANGPLSS